MTLWQKKVFYLIENDYVCPPEIILMSPEIATYIGLCRFTFHRFEFYTKDLRKIRIVN